MEQIKSRARMVAVNATLVVLALGLLGLAIHDNRARIREVLRRPVDLRLLAAMLAIYLLALVLSFVRWYILVRALDLPFRLRDALRLGFIGNVFNLVIPGSVGGDVIKAAFLCREQARKTQAVASMVIDRVLGLIGLFALAGVAGAVAWDGSGPDVRRLIVVVWVALAAGLLGLAVIFTPALYRPLQRLVSGRGRLETFFAELVAMASSYRRRIGIVAVALALAVGIHCLYVLAFYGVSRAVFPSGLPSVANHLVIVPLILFSTVVPLPFGALGLTEQVSDRLFRLVAHPGGAVAMMAYRLVVYAGGLISLVVYVANAGEVRGLEEEATPAHLDEP